MRGSVKSLMASAVIVLVAALSGCGVTAAGSGVQDNMSASNAQASVAAVNQTGSGVKANTETNTKTKAKGNSSSGGKTVIGHRHCSAETQGGLAVDKPVKQFNESNDHIQIVAEYNPDMYKGPMQSLQTETAAGNSPALVQTGWAFLDYFSNNFSYMSPQEAIDKFDRENTGFLQDKFLPNILELAVNSEDSQVGIPYFLSNPVPYINKDILGETGLPEEGPATWQEVNKLAEIVKEKTGEYEFYMQEPADFWAQQGLIESSGAKILTINAEGKKEAAFATEDRIEVMQLMADMVKDRTALHISWEGGCQGFINGNCVMPYTIIVRRASAQKDARFDAATVKSPLWNDKERMAPAGGCPLAITAQGDDQVKAIWEFEKLPYGVESMATWTEGTDCVPPREDVVGAENGFKTFLAGSKMMNTAIKRMDGVVPQIALPGDAGLWVEQMLLGMRDQILGGQVMAERGMKATQDVISQLLAV